ncbi:hypothetical protein Cpap_3443 [Ruminiclostridium papyrosolvens DSM 2782]|uniref:DUF948 domain-containing protein n=1 Tax=Ruminiclostridium papyrosolvens DSM 2782 TaxID=588581 RepID=F1T933_9FIRM|nr:hypothetical protein [Ruminiclostridium papyrosolvens]EGD49015.1 hypothetical protein Cpap_3443 [Ruminiclostridium papyrosolvens DSM 2782]WES35498.1 hypothetical protein P0092_05850 [Ruminiclostridium papyrosolvens DSM 2782]
MSITLDLSVVAWFILFCIAVIIGVLLIIVLRNCLKITDRVNKILDDNADSVGKTLEVLPSTVANIDELAKSAKGTLDKATSVVTTVEDSVSETIDSFSFNAENILNIINIASSVVKSIISSFSSKH